MFIAGQFCSSTQRENIGLSEIKAKRSLWTAHSGLLEPERSESDKATADK